MPEARPPIGSPAPPPLGDERAYQTWRDAKLRAFARTGGLPVVEIRDLARPQAGEMQCLREALDWANMVVVRSEGPIDADALLALGRYLGLVALDRNPCADEQAVSRLEQRPTRAPGEYIPYTDKALGWHTDGYYNPLNEAVRAWMLFCVRPAATGGENALLDPELAYLWLRDRDPGLIAALMHPAAISIPANRRDGRELRPETQGPVFALCDDRLVMRFSARGQNIRWHPAAETARAALTELFSSASDFILRHKLSAGEGYITRNVLHTRTAFTDGPNGGRLLLRVRYRDALL
jgi:hypothetical protein